MPGQTIHLDEITTGIPQQPSYFPPSYELAVGERIFEPYRSTVLQYVDDLLIVSEDVSGHAAPLTEVLQALEKGGFKAKPKKAQEEFWIVYKDGDQCASDPCQNGGSCQDLFQRYLCICPEKFEGWNCETEKTNRVECIFENGYCEQFCSDVANASRQCSCTEDYRLGDDGISCIAKVPYPCGKVPVLMNKKSKPDEYKNLGRIVGGSDALKGEYPWQVLLNYKQEMDCGAVLLSPQWVVTAAHCVYGKNMEDFEIVAGEHQLKQEEFTEQRRNVSRMILHENYNTRTIDNDIALLKFDAPIVLDDYAVPVCLPKRRFALRELSHIRYSIVSGWGRRLEGGIVAPKLQKLRVPLVQTSECRRTTDNIITENMFCAGYNKEMKDSCKGDSGGPHVTEYKGSWFLTGIVSWGEGCARVGKYGIYTKVYKYLEWIGQYINENRPTTSPDILTNQTESTTFMANISHV
ncbi:LOW QUALITY PROTEIN: coagulation factor VII-like [Scyliorhinus canicula]|uniref:LOW QUALITY PROTEIN: coagulation factor VII-like n=1 Tax=Scyliorhinus canicula TaxID=7830 RepID=UPI0018F5CD3A|nr:LOW QUALITY PROTEIN: coagulation factor VII-like [Scyliorhinus canicula]